MAEWDGGPAGSRVAIAVRADWTRQWGMLDPHVEPVGFETDNEGRITVDVHQTVCDLDGGVLLDRTVQHIYLISDGLIRRMDIRE